MDARKVALMLDLLGTDSVNGFPEVRATLAWLGCTGFVCSAGGWCPLERYLALCGVVDPVVNGLYVWWGGKDENRLKLPWSLRRFATRFDAEDFPELVSR